MFEDTSKERQVQLDDYTNFSKIIDEGIAGVISALDWTMESVTSCNSNFVTCPYDRSHRFTEETLNNHLSACQWKAEGYTAYDIPLSEPPISQDVPTAIKLDEQLRDEVLRKAKEQDPLMKVGVGERLIPRTSDRLLIEFTTDERRALYDYIIANTVKPEIGYDLADINKLKSEGQEEKQMSFLEMLAQERDLKRRRTKHRGIHTNKKSQVEILREVINQQMEVYTEYLSERYGIKKSNENFTRESNMSVDENSTAQFKKEIQSFEAERKFNHALHITGKGSSRQWRDERNERSRRDDSYRSNCREQAIYSSKRSGRSSDRERDHRKRSRSQDQRSHTKIIHRHKEHRHTMNEHKFRERVHSRHKNHRRKRSLSRD